MIKLIIFDLWKTLAYKKGNRNHSSLKKMMKGVGVEIPLDKFIVIYENSIQTKRWKSEYEAYENLCKNMGAEVTKKNVDLLMNIRDNVEKEAFLYSHTISMLRKLKKAGYKIGLLSNASVYSSKYIVEHSDLLKYIDYPLFSYNIGVVKPDLRFYKTMLKKTKCKPGETIMIGNSLTNDVLPPKKIGMKSIHYKNYSQLKKELRTLGILI